MDNIDKLEDSVIDAYLSGNISEQLDCKDFCDEKSMDDCDCFQVCVDTLAEKLNVHTNTTDKDDN